MFVTESYGPGSALLRVRPGGYDVVRRETKRREQSMSCHFMTPIHLDGYLYGSSGQSSGEAELRAVELATGNVAWTTPGLGRATMLYVDGHLVVLTERGRLLLVEATPRGYRPVADVVPRFPTAPPSTAAAKSAGEARTDESAAARDEARQVLRYPAWTPPALADGVLYLRGKGRLAAFELIPEPRRNP